LGNASCIRITYTAGVKKSPSTKKNRLYRRVEWQRPIFPEGYPSSIIGAERLHCRVRDGNGCFPFAIVTTPPACTCFLAICSILQYPQPDRTYLEREHPGGDEGIRTPDLRRAKAALFQLSYVPSCFAVSSNGSYKDDGRGWAFLDSNQGPQSYQDCALTT
jgi:hypothetical protein